MNDDRTHARRFHDALKHKRLKQRKMLREEAVAQGGPDDMHDEPDREMRILFDCCDDVIREPDAIKGAEELEQRTRVAEQQAYVDNDFEAVDDLRQLTTQDFDLV